MIRSGGNLPTKNMEEGKADYSRHTHEVDHEEMIAGVEAALRRASENAIARARAAGLDPVISTAEDKKT